jgi:hypothetical protein
VVGVVALVGAAAAGARTLPGEPQPAIGRPAASLSPSSAPVSRPPSPQRGRWPPWNGIGLAPPPVLLDRPQLRGAEIRTATLAVEGVLRIKADSVRVSLQTLDHVTLDSATFRTANLDGGIRPVRAPTIDVEFPVPEPRPLGQRLWIIVTAFDADGRALGVVRRVVTIESLAVPSPR